MAQVHVGWLEDGTAVFAFRGTATMKDGLADVKIMRLDVAYLRELFPGARAHLGVCSLLITPFFAMSTCQLVPPSACKVAAAIPLNLLHRPLCATLRCLWLGVGSHSSRVLSDMFDPELLSPAESFQQP